MVGTLKLADIINPRLFSSHPSYPLKPFFKIDLCLQNSRLTYNNNPKTSSNNESPETAPFCATQHEPCPILCNFCPKYQS